MPEVLEPIDLVKIAKRYGRKWVALTLDMRRIRASGNSVEEVEKKLAEKGIPVDEVMITKPPRPDTCLAI